MGFESNLIISGALLLPFLFGQTVGYNYDIGFEYRYQYKAESLVLGDFRVVTIVKFHVRPLEWSNGSLICHLHVDSFTQSAGGRTQSNPVGWNFKNGFEFSISEDGLINEIAHHHKEKSDVLNLKKALASVLSAKGKIHHSDKQRFNNWEHDHAGYMEHQYTVHTTDSGYRVNKFHESKKRVYRKHAKTLHYSHSGLIEYVKADDKIILRSKNKNKPPETRYSVPVKKEIEEETTGELRDIESSTSTEVKLISKVQLSKAYAISPLHKHLKVKDSIVVQREKHEKTSLSKVERDIETNVTCIQSYKDEVHRNRMDCFAHLLQIMQRIRKDGYEELATRELSRKCRSNDTMCFSRRNIFIDLLLKEGQNITQNLIIQHFLKNKNVNETIIFRIFFHISDLKHPLLAFLEAVEELCLGPNHTNIGTIAMTKKQKYACLALGTLIKTFRNNNKHSQKTDHLLDSLKKWLSPHNQTNYKEMYREQRQRRSVDKFDRKLHNHTYSKMVLIHTLGNSGSARDHLLTYMKPGEGDNSWRRAAILGMRHFNCVESSATLLDLAVNDEHVIVRKQALERFENHPLSKKSVSQHRDIILSRDYRYQTLMRIKRGILKVQAGIDGFLFSLKLPGVQWSKQLGNSSLGATFGLELRNELRLEIKPLSAHALLDIYDDAYAKVTIDWLEIDEYLFRAHVCYRGHAGYDVNILKDLGVDGIQDLVLIFDKIVKSIVEPVKDVIKKFENIVNHMLDKGIEYIVNKIIELVKKLPLILKTIIKNVIKAVMKVIEYGGVPWIDQIKKIITKTRLFIEEIKEDVTQFYNTIADAITVTLPYIGKKLMDTVATVFWVVRNFLSDPVQSVTKFGKCVLDIKLAIGMFLDVKNRIVEQLSFLKGGTPFWVDYWEDFQEIWGDVEDLFRLLFEKRESPATSEFDDAFSTSLTDGISMTKERSNIFIEIIEKSFGAITAQFKETLTELVEPFLEAFQSVLNAVKAIKSAYIAVRDIFMKVKNIVQKIFGSKFHITFPNRRRSEDSTCGAGVFPSTTNERYQTIGVDVQVSYKTKILCPLDGKVIRETNRVKILPIEADFIEYEVIIENIIPNTSIAESGQSLTAGQDIIGEADRSPCDDNSIHVSVRKRSSIETKDSDYEYIDPSPFLDHLVPTPEWIWDCKDFTYINAISVVAADAVDGAEEGIEKVEEELSRLRIEGSDDLGNQFPPEQPNYRPPEFKVATPDDPVAVDQWNKFKEGFKGLVSGFKDIAKQLFDFSGNRTGPNLLDLVDVNSYTLGRIQELLGKKVGAEMKIIFDKLMELRSSITAQNLDGLSISDLRTLLSMSFNSVTGSKSNMISRVLSKTENDCPMFQNRLSKGPGNVCFVHRSCSEISCAVLLSHATHKFMATVDIKMDGCLKQVTLKSRSNNATISFGDGEDIEERVSLVEVSTLMSANLVVSISFDWSTPIISISAELCVNDFISCLHIVPVLLNYELDTTCPQEDGSGSKLPTMDSIAVQDFIAELSEHHLLDQNILRVLDTIREAMMDQLINDPRTILKILGKEFKNKIDFCEEVDVPFPTGDFLIANETFGPIMAGPIPIYFELGAAASVGLRIHVGLCIKNCNVKGILTPWSGAKVWGGAYVGYFIFKAGIRLTGHLLEARFPLTAEIIYNKFPLDVRGSLDLTLAPLRLKLEAYCILEFKVCTLSKCYNVSLTIFRGTLWSFAVRPVSANIFTNIKDEKDASPPEFVSPGLTSRRKRETTDKCIIKQISGRNYNDTAYELQIAADDDKSNLKIFYAIGLQQGGTNVVDFTEMGGFSVLVATNDLPNGVPLYWTVKAVNSQGTDARVYCMLSTYDNTLPDGRVDPSYLFSANPNVLTATITVFDDSDLKQIHSHALGYSSGKYGSEVVPWKDLTLGSTTLRTGITSNLKHFSVPNNGKLTSIPFSVNTSHTPEDCATQCIKSGEQCVSFDYDFFTESCELQNNVESPNVMLRMSGTYVNYERLGIGYNSYERYDNISLEHGTVYFFNARITNVLGYVGFLQSYGTMVDFSPPNTGSLGTNYSETFSADSCNASAAQRCVEVTWKKNHRQIIDGKGATTVFNGHTPLKDKMYTRSNHYISVNFDGFHDDESGIYQYTWAAGRAVCYEDVVNFRDPHEFLHSSKHWTHSGYEKNMFLLDGKYFLTVQCLNNVVFGGSLVTTVCHSTPLTVDTTPPFFNGVEEIYFDEHFDILGIYYKAGDNESFLRSVDFGLGNTKYDVLVRKYSYHKPMNGDDAPYIVIEELDLEEGVPAWPRVRVDNGVGLFKAGSGPEPILIDRSPPVAGQVLDGHVVHHDLTYQSTYKEICAQWKGFFDPESGIDHFRWGVGTLPGKDNVVAFYNISHNTRHSCSDVVLQHNTRYYSTVIVFNAALNSKDSNSTSNGVLVDKTPPVPGYAVDGPTLLEDTSFSSETATKSVTWENFTDPESGIEKYYVSVFINDAKIKKFDSTTESTFIDHSISMEHNDKVYFKVESVNKAGLSTNVRTNGYIVDHTPPYLISIRDNENGEIYQTDDNFLKLRWQFEDSESGIKEYRYTVYEYLHGTKKRFWPKMEMFLTTLPNPKSGTVAVDFDEQILVAGAKYSVHVTAINMAQLSTSHESEGVIIDPTPPVIFKVHVGLLEEEEEMENGYIQHANSQSIRVSWIGDDPESHISKFFVAIGTSQGDTSVTHGYIDMAKEISADFKVSLSTFSETGEIYYVAVKAENGAGILSSPLYSKPIMILRENVPGIIFDGREPLIDEDYTHDRFSIGMHFHSFESEACNIVKYEWAIGSKPFFSDINGYTEYGIVHNETHGKAQAHVELKENETYYATVRAKTGHNCHEMYIVSTSDGITPDVSPPEISNIAPKNSEGVVYDSDSQNIFQSYIDSFEYKWNINDQTELQFENYSIGSMPMMNDIFSSSISSESKISPSNFSPKAGKTYYVNVYTEDSVGFFTSSTSMPIVADISPPMLQNFSCTNIISTKQSTIKCSWVVIEKESKVTQISICVGSQELIDDIIQNVTLPSYQNDWTVDVKKHQKLNSLNYIYVSLTVTNVIAHSQTNIFKIEIDLTPPVIKNIEFVTWTNPDKNYTRQICQLPWSYVDVNILVLEDEESDIDSAEICLGSEPATDNIKSYQELEKTYMTIDNIYVPPGTRIYATVRAYNKVGLHSVITSEPIVVSPDPRIDVFDGKGDRDSDFQIDLNLIQGSYQYSDNCPIIEAQWSVEDLTGKVIQNYTDVPGNGFVFYNDQLSLRNNYLYYVKVKVTDALNRTKVGISDGITVRIQPPVSGIVRDGLGSEDIDYQESRTELSANWNDFGDGASGDPTQKIDYYEVSIGDDTRDHITRTNIHYYIKVGLNTSYTFFGLELTPKTVRYYITVRGYSITGAFEESYSNGVRVGFRPGIIPGVIESEDVQSSTSEISVSWSGFSSDIGIKEYYVAVSTALVINSNKTFSCSDVQKIFSQFDIVSPKITGLDTLQTLKNLTLNHGMSYYVTVIASDEVGKCSSIESRPILVDTTSPDQSNVTIMVNGWNVTGREKFFVTDSNEIEIKLINIKDPESGINVVTFRLYGYSDCPASKTPSTYILEEIQAINDAKVTMTHLELESMRYYYITVTISNNAGLESSLVTPVMLLDTGSPHVGSAIAGNNWGQKILYQSSTSNIKAWTAIARTEDAYECDNTKVIFPSDETSLWSPLSGDFSEGNVLKDDDRWVLKIGYNVPLTKVLKSGISSPIGGLRKGEYSTILSTAEGRNISTSFIVSTSNNNPYFPVTFTRPPPTDFNKVNFNTSETKLSSKNISYLSNKTENWIPSIQNSSSSYVVNKTDLTNKSVKKDVPSGFGFEILGDQQEESEVWDCLFWAKDDYDEFHRWTQIQNDPVENQHEYSIQTIERYSDDEKVWDLEFLVNGDLKANIYGLSFDSTDLNIFVHTWNFDNYEEPIIDPIHPYRSQAVLTKIKIPTNESLDCINGRGFYDGESGIAEIWVGISDNVEESGNIKEFELYKKMCTPCLFNCNFSCDANCSSYDGSLPDFEKIPLTLENLDLKSTILSNDGLNASVQTEIVNMTEYYVNVKMVNFAGQPVSTITNPVIVDITPPVCEYIRCLDPDVTGMGTPTDKLGSNKTIGAYWLCEDNISGIKKFIVKVGTENSAKGNKEDENMIPQKPIGTVSKIRLDLDDDVFFENKKTYYVNLIVINGANLSTVYSCSVSTMLTPPDVSDVDSKMMNSAMIDEETGTVFMDSLDRFGVKWNNRKNDTKYYKWKMGTYEGGTDIIPLSIIGVTNEGIAEIIGGELWLNGNKTGKSLAAFAPETWGNLTGSEVDNEENNFRFQMEPGRCVFLSLVAFGYSNLETTISSQKLCFERKDRDLVLNGEHENVTTIALLSDSKFKEVSDLDRSENIVINIKGKISGVSIGSLTESDLMADYGSASASDFNSYLTNPSTTDWASTRDIRNRIVKPLGVNFFIAPTRTMEVEFIDVDFKLNLDDFDNSTVPALLLWDSYTFNPDSETYGIWRHVEGNCGEDIKSPIIEGNIFKTKICHKTFQTSSRKRRSTTSLMSNPYQYTLTVMNLSFYNSPPEVEIDTIKILEDRPIIDFQIPYHDNEMDSVQFYLLEMSDIGFVNLTTDGILSYYPKEDFFGKDSIQIALKDDAENSTIVNKTIWIEVDEVNDMPMFGYLYNDSSYNVMKNKSLTLILEGNSTFHHLFNFGFADVDNNETLSFISSLSNTADVHITTTRIDTEWILNETFEYKDVRTHLEYSADIVINKTFHGDLFYYILGFDSHNFFTERLETHIFILWSPCVYGFCSPKSTSSPSCQDISRAASFDLYKCTCYPGYMGMWCENEINECLQQPCGILFNCEDKINSYKCIIKQEGIAGLIIVGLVVIILLFILYRFFCCNAKTYRVAHNRDGAVDESNGNLLIGFRILPSIAKDFQPHYEKTEIPLHDMIKSPLDMSTTLEDETAVKHFGDRDSQGYHKHVETGISRKTTDLDSSVKTLIHYEDKEKPLFAKIRQKLEKKPDGVPYADPIVVLKNPCYSPELRKSNSLDDKSDGFIEALDDKLPEVKSPQNFLLESKPSITDIKQPNLM